MPSPSLSLSLGCRFCLWFAGALAAAPNPNHRRPRYGSIVSANATLNSTASLSFSSSSAGSAGTPTPVASGPLGDTPTLIPPGTIALSTGDAFTPTLLALGNSNGSPAWSSDTPTPIPPGTLTGYTDTATTTTSNPWKGTDAVAASDAPAAASLTGTGLAPLGSAPLPSLVTGNGSLPPFPLQNRTIVAAGTGRPSGTAVDACGGCTVNVHGASVAYWFPATYEATIGTVKTIWGTANSSWYALSTGTTSFNVTSAWQTSGAFTTTVIFIPGLDFGITSQASYSSTPQAVSTSVVSMSSVIPLPTTTNNIDSVWIDPGLATVGLPLPSGTISTATSTTSVVYFSAYEIQRRAQATQANGQVVCSTATAAFNLSRPFAFDYSGDALDEAASASGALPSTFLLQIPQKGCVAGRWDGVVTVIFVVYVTYDLEYDASPNAGHLEITASSGFPGGFLSGLTPEAGHIPTSTTTTTTTIPTSEVHVVPTTTSIRVAPQTSSTPVVVVVGSNTAVIGSSSQVIIGSQTLTPGAPPITIDRTPVSLAPSGTAIVVGGITSVVGHASSGVVVAIPPPSPHPVPIITIGSITVTGNAATQFSIGPGSTLTPGGTVVVSGTTVSLDPSASIIVIGGATQIIPTPAPSVGVFTVGGTSIIGNGGSTFVVGGQTLTPGGSPITVGGGPGGETTISLAAGGSSVVVNGMTQQVTPVVTPAPLTLGGTTFSVTDGSTFVLGSQTLLPGQVVTFTDGQGQVTTISLGPSASFAVVNGATTTLSPNAVITAAPPVITVGGSVFSVQPGPGTTYLIGGSMLTPGGQIVVTDASGQVETISLSPGATALVVNGETTLLADPGSSTTNAPLVTFDGTVFSALPGGTTYIIDGQTLVPGSSIVVDGTTISLSPQATALIVNGQTTTLFPATTTRLGGPAPIAGLSSLIANTPINTGAATTTTKKGGAGSFRSTDKGSILSIGVSATLGALLATLALFSSI